MEKSSVQSLSESKMLKQQLTERLIILKRMKLITISIPDQQTLVIISLPSLSQLMKERLI